ncbi:unnamed protein product [Strongylus vulgaris]|uniref:Uncharacterized protein n=1 Tax=Strongylus vulgaris TaxID=40348 RepID=A0A3P7JV16_STRVU|nr:unnamed protein product [Strongylus vulgaris]
MVEYGFCSRTIQQFTVERVLICLCAVLPSDSNFAFVAHGQSQLKILTFQDIGSTRIERLRVTGHWVNTYRTAAGVRMFATNAGRAASRSDPIADIVKLSYINGRPKGLRPDIWVRLAVANSRQWAEHSGTDISEMCRDHQLSLVTEHSVNNSFSNIRQQELYTLELLRINESNMITRERVECGAAKTDGGRLCLKMLAVANSRQWAEHTGTDISEMCRDHQLSLITEHSVNNSFSNIRQEEPYTWELLRINGCNMITRLKDIPEHSFDGLPQLRFLRAEQNHICSFSPNALAEVKGNLELLDLSGNCFSAIPAQNLRNSVKLMYLDLSDNKIGEVRFLLT